jgi:hypothetical protein
MNPAMKSVVLPVSDSRAPKYWMNETSGVLAPIIHAYLKHQPMTYQQVKVMGAYLSQWIDSPVWYGNPTLERLQRDAHLIQTRADIARWLTYALEQGIDPL